MAVFLSPIGGAGAQFFSNDGIPLSGGKIYSYLAGTTTPHPTYTTSAGNIAHSNPIVLDAAGRIPAGGEIWFDDQTSYKLVLESASNVLIATWDNLSGINDLTAAQIPYLPAGANAVVSTVQNKLRESVSVKDFGALGNGSANDTTAIVNTFTYIQTQGGGSVFFPPGTYNIACPINGVLISLSNLDGISIIGHDVIIQDTTTYVKTSPNAEVSTFIEFSYCLGVYFGPNITIKSTVIYDGFSAGSQSEGLLALFFKEGCRKIDVTGTFNNLGYWAIGTSGTAGVSGAARTKDINVKAIVTNSRYAYVSQFNGDNAFVQLDTDNVGRVYFLYGVENVKINTNSKNSRTSLIKSYEGYGCSDIEIWHNEKGGTTYNLQPAMSLISVHWGDEFAATHRNIKLHLDVVCTAPNPWGNTVTFEKFGPGNNPDPVGRGHALINFELTGRMTRPSVPGVANFAFTVGAFATPDVMRNIYIHDLYFEGGSFSFVGTTSSTNLFSNIQSTGNLYCIDPEEPAVFLNCAVGNFTSGTNETSKHIYISSNITSGGLQSYDANKKFIETLLPSNNRLNKFSNSYIFNVASKASRYIDGSLTATTSIFRIPPSTVGMMRLSYYLVYDNSDYSAGTRRETYGTKIFSLGVDSSGNFILFTSVNDMITERTLNASPAVLTVTGLTGNSTDGGYIQVAATNYNQSTSYGAFEAEFTGTLGIGIFAA